MRWAAAELRAGPAVAATPYVYDDDYDDYGYGLRLRLRAGHRLLCRAPLSPSGTAAGAAIAGNGQAGIAELARAAATGQGVPIRPQRRHQSPGGIAAASAAASRPVASRSGGVGQGRTARSPQRRGGVDARRGGAAIRRCAGVRRRRRRISADGTAAGAGETLIAVLQSRRMSAGSARLARAEHALEDRVDVLEVIAEVELRLRSRRRSRISSRPCRPSAASRKSPSPRHTGIALRWTSV